MLTSRFFLDSFIDVLNRVLIHANLHVLLPPGECVWGVLLADLAEDTLAEVSIGVTLTGDEEDEVPLHEPEDLDETFALKKNGERWGRFWKRGDTKCASINVHRFSVVERKLCNRDFIMVQSVAWLCGLEKSREWVAILFRATYQWR